MKSRKNKLYEMYDIDGSKTITYSRLDAKEAFEKGFTVVENMFLSCQATRYIKSTSIISKQWVRKNTEQ